MIDQGYPDLEYFVVDGGSTDESVEVIRRYADRIDWWVSEPDQGQTDAINKGLARATGDVIAYINSDDYYLPGSFEKAMGALERSDAGWVAGAAINVDEHDRPGPGDEAWRRFALRIPILPRTIAAMPQGRAMKKPPALRKTRRMERGPRKTGAGRLPGSWVREAARRGAARERWLAGAGRGAGPGWDSVGGAPGAIRAVAAVPPSMPRTVAPTWTSSPAPSATGPEMRSPFT